LRNCASHFSVGADFGSFLSNAMPYTLHYYVYCSALPMSSPKFEGFP
jgi:hypothetical protein